MGEEKQIKEKSGSPDFFITARNTPKYLTHSEIITIGGQNEEIIVEFYCFINLIGLDFSVMHF